ncbi:NAD(P)-dependent alcohol dehydrogenase [Variovorax sp. J22G21]|uniref:NAD(P)-dependent alcohol dehydrogenase n=1 Tax=Variovorax fucosicus TaxID=3053517 RepID=UPI0025781422|nr:MULTISPECIES: NAD(P)-dependent alcohol dehydrogenase [unclassified Variovorax]MDM0042800.1 NAD(P)-dependent alcohol dehydrogenase [Variovorax sp. J22R193]MDM0064805.1 NAD(P)-dependent alcohol dehydrogenase [Variovorax sp. J22G21]
MTLAHAYAAQSATTPLAPFTFQRRFLTARDVAIDILYCGVCHSDLHTARSEWGPSVYPCVPGHEIVGRVSEVGTDVSKFKVGDFVGVGCMVDSCQHCQPCAQGLEQYCDNGMTGTYNSQEQVSRANTLGGYSDHIVVSEKFVLRISHREKALAAVAPLLCAGITTYSPLRYWKVGPGQKVGIVGLGGLGHMGIKIAAALGAHVVLFTTSPSKTEDALRLGAKEVVVSENADALAIHRNSFDFILDTVAVTHNLDPLVTLLKMNGTLVLVGIPSSPNPSPGAFGLISKRRSISGSMIGGIAETQEMLDFCAKHNIVSDVEIIKMPQINEAYERMLKSDVKYRFVIDMATVL